MELADGGCRIDGRTSRAQLDRNAEVEQRRVCCSRGRQAEAEADHWDGGQAKSCDGGGWLVRRHGGIPSATSAHGAGAAQPASELVPPAFDREIHIGRLASTLGVDGK